MASKGQDPYVVLRFAEAERDETFTHQEWSLIERRLPATCALVMWCSPVGPDGQPKTSNVTDVSFPWRDFHLLRDWLLRLVWPQSYFDGCLLWHEMDRWQIPIPVDFFWRWPEHWNRPGGLKLDCAVECNRAGDVRMISDLTITWIYDAPSEDIGRDYVLGDREADALRIIRTVPIEDPSIGELYTCISYSARSGRLLFFRSFTGEGYRASFLWQRVTDACGQWDGPFTLGFDVWDGYSQYGFPERLLLRRDFDGGNDSDDSVQKVLPPPESPSWFYLSFLSATPTIEPIALDESFELKDNFGVLHDGKIWATKDGNFCLCDGSTGSTLGTWKFNSSETKQRLRTRLVRHDELIIVRQYKKKEIGTRVLELYAFDPNKDELNLVYHQEHSLHTGFYTVHPSSRESDLLWVEIGTFSPNRIHELALLQILPSGPARVVVDFVDPLVLLQGLQYLDSPIISFDIFNSNRHLAIGWKKGFAVLSLADTRPMFGPDYIHCVSAS